MITIVDLKRGSCEVFASVSRGGSWHYLRRVFWTHSRKRSKAGKFRTGRPTRTRISTDGDLTMFEKNYGMGRKRPAGRLTSFH